jgi:hypothetical protein
MAFDAARGQTLVYGGEDPQGNVLSDLWAWNGMRWMQLCSSAPCSDIQPVGRVFPTMAYDSTRKSTLLYAGCSQLISGACAGAQPDVWEWTGSAWRDIGVSASSGTAPAPDQSMQMAFDPKHGRMLVAYGRGPGVATFVVQLLEVHVIGDACTGNATCDTGVCEDGVCCEAACTDPCDSCNTPASPGVCSSRPSCVLACDGDHTLTTSDGKGAKDCSPYECEPGGKCKMTCTNAADCAVPDVCDPSSHSCVPPQGGSGGGGAGGGGKSSGCALGQGDVLPGGLALVAVAMAVARARRRAAR